MSAIAQLRARVYESLPELLNKSDNELLVNDYLKKFNENSIELENYSQNLKLIEGITFETLYLKILISLSLYIYIYRFY